jgi:hypothetical protein
MQQVIVTPPANCLPEKSITPPTELRSDPASNSDKRQSTAPLAREVLFSPPSSFCRRSAREKPSKLVYDEKYHPLDDVIRPSHAAKRRLIHGEEYPSEDELSVSSFDGSDATTYSDVEEASSPVKAKPAKKGSKRVKFDIKLPEPTRRSSRQKSQPRVSYNALVHPQDDLLELAFAEDETAKPFSASKRRRRSSDRSDGEDEQSDDDSGPTGSRQQSGCITINSDGMLLRKIDYQSSHFACCSFAGYNHTCISEILTTSPDTVPESPDPFRSSSPSSPIETVASDQSPITFKQPQADQQFLRNRGSLPETRGEHFELWVDNFNDQLARDANAASPLRFDHDDKENDVSNPDLELEPDVNRGVSVMPLSLHRSSVGGHRISGGTSMAQEALYSHDESVTTPYGLGASTTYGTVNNGPQFQPDYMRLLASSEHLPRDDS